MDSEKLIKYIVNKNILILYISDHILVLKVSYYELRTVLLASVFLNICTHIIIIKYCILSLKY